MNRCFMAFCSGAALNLERYGSWKTVYSDSENGSMMVSLILLRILSLEAELEELSIDASVYPCTVAGYAKKSSNEIGHSQWRI